MFMPLKKKDAKKKKSDATTATVQDKSKADDEVSAKTNKTRSARRTTTTNRHSAPSGNAADCKKLVHSFVGSTLHKGVMGLRSEFISHKRVNDLTKMTVFLKNATKNRYKDVGCIDETRVVLKDTDNDYIHANYVTTPNSDKRFICCQAPLDNTCEDHWRMIVQESADVILMLCNLTEKGAKKCAEYFPSEVGGSKTFGQYTIKAARSSKVRFPFTTTANVKVTSLTVEVNGKQVHTVDHYHWIDWPDRGVPVADMSPIFLLQKIAGTQNPIIVHCSAGIGRTGSIVLIQYTLESIAAGQTCENIETLMLKLRKQRANSVQTDQQYLYVHQVLLIYFQKEGFLDKSVLPFLEAFTAQYKKAVITG